MATKIKATSQKRRPVQKKTTKTTPRRKPVVKKATVQETPVDVKVEDFQKLVDATLDNINLQKMENELYTSNIIWRIQEDMAIKEHNLAIARENMQTLKAAYRKAKGECSKMAEDVGKLNEMISTLSFC